MITEDVRRWPPAHFKIPFILSPACLLAFKSKSLVKNCDMLVWMVHGMLNLIYFWVCFSVPVGVAISLKGQRYCVGSGCAIAVGFILVAYEKAGIDNMLTLLSIEFHK